MTEPNPSKVETLFFDAVELPPDQRAAFLDRHCQGDATLRQQVDALLAADAAAGGDDFLEADFLGSQPRFDSNADASDLSPESNDTPADGNDTTEQHRFRILSQHRQGGLGEVLIAYDRQLNRDVAIKQIKPKWQSHEEARHRFAQEAEVTGRLEHPGVVPVYAMGHWEDGRPYYAMRFIQGTTLADEIKEHHADESKLDQHSHALHLRNLLNRFVSVCNTIDYAHSRQVLHRDIKPSNIMAGRYGETLVVDWGLAKLLDTPTHESVTAGLMSERRKQQGDSTPTQVGGAVGTPQYMSPEQASGQLDEIGVRTDIYLLGATLYQILTGKPPHADESVSKMIERIKQGTLVRPRSIDPGIPPALESICLKAMASDTASRYRTARQLSDDIERWMAGEPVSVHADPVTVRLGRWLRRHRTVAASAAVAAILITVGSIGGSAVWNYQQAEKFRVEQEKLARETELEINRQQRDTELRASVDAAIVLAETELKSGRFSSAHSILQGELEAIRSEPAVIVQCQQLQKKADRLRQIVVFYEQADRSHVYNALSRDTKATIACTEALGSLGVLDKDAWWTSLPDEDLTPKQKDQLRWDVYRQLIVLDALMVKAIGTRLSGGNRRGNAASILSLTERFLTTSLGKQEAAIAVTLSDRIDRFRVSEATRWYRSIAQFRLDEGSRLRGSDLEAPRNAADAHSLGVLCMIAALDSSFQIFFRDYQGQNALQAAKDLFRWASDLDPRYYWTQLSLAQTEYLHERNNDNQSWRKYDSAIQAVGRCIALEPDKCFAYADRSSMFRSKAALIRRDESLPEDFRQTRVTELLRWSLEDATEANRLGPDQHWLGWQHGLAMYESGQTDQALERFLRASKLTLPFAEVEDAALVTVDDVRGRQEAIMLANRLLQDEPDNAICQTLAASIQLNQHQLNDAISSASRAIEIDSSAVHAYAVRGMARYQQDSFAKAAEDFRIAVKLAPNHDWVRFGLSACQEALREFDQALDGYIEAFRQARTDEHRSACLLGKSRVLAILGKFREARDTVTEAYVLEPASNIKAVGIPLRDYYIERRKADPDSELTQSLLEYVQWLNRLPRPTEIDVSPVRSGYYAAVLNHDFELGNTKYWIDPSGVSWVNLGEYTSTANVDDTVSHGGKHSLHIVGAAAPDPGLCGKTRQVVPVRQGSSLRLAVWVKAKSLTRGALTIRDSSENTVLAVPPGSYDWTRFEADIAGARNGEETPDPSSATNVVDNVVIEIVSSGAGEVWLDDIELRVE